MNTPLLELDRVSVSFSGAGGLLRRGTPLPAVTDASLTVAAGETVALVGESGSGKTTLVRTVLGLAPVTGGSVRFRGAITASMGRSARRDLRRSVQMVFQDPFGSLNPRMTVGAIVAEPLVIHGIGDRTATVARTMEQVGLPRDAVNRYPHQFSGGQRQRIAIARALAPGPALIIADEPLSALDVSIQSQILNLLADLRESEGLSYLLVSHDLNAVHHLADRIAVMYLGRVVETAPKQALFDRPAHPYTAALLRAMPRLSLTRREPGRGLGGEVPSPLHPPSGCAFHPRCPRARDDCRTTMPLLRATAPDRSVACHDPLGAA